MFRPYGVPVERLFDHQYLIAPVADHWWENGVTFNSAAIYLPRSAENDTVIKGLLGKSRLEESDLADGVVAMHYRARPMEDVGYRWQRSFIGLAVFTPELKLLKRFDEPVALPGEKPSDFDYLGLEDPRVTRIEDKFYMVYKGSSDAGDSLPSLNCVACSDDLIKWEKFGPFKGSFDKLDNKNGVLFPCKIDGYYFLLHRPWGASAGGLSKTHLRIARSKEIAGYWDDCGVVLPSFRIPCCPESWNGSGSTPIPLGNKKFLVVYHSGKFHWDGEKEYDINVALFNFNRFDPKNPSAVVEKIIEPLMVPETDIERKPGVVDKVTNAIYTCGAYGYKGWIYIVYGAGDTITTAARIKTDDILDALEKSDNKCYPEPCSDCKHKMNLPRPDWIKLLYSQK